MGNNVLVEADKQSVVLLIHTLTKVLVGITDIKLHGQHATPSSHCAKVKPLNGRKQLTFSTLSE